MKKSSKLCATLLSSSTLILASGTTNAKNNENFTTTTFFEKLVLKEVSGTVTETSGLPLLGADIVVKGTSRGTQTNFDGQFTIDLEPGDIIVVSYLGFATQEITYAGQDTLNIVLESESSALSEIVVTGYSAQSTRDITGSVEVVDVENVQKTAPLNIEQALQGQAAGVTVSSEGGPGGGASVKIRGFSTLNGTEPLYIIDGTPTGGGINEINPADIQSIQVLKDASAAAIYGNRALNGVVIVTTKNGKRNQKSRLTINTWTGIDYIPSGALPDLATPQQLAEAEFQKQRNSGLTPSHPQYGSGATPVLPNFIIPTGADTADLSNYSPSNPISRANKNGTDWFGEYFDAAIVHNTSIGISGGSEDANYYAGMGILDQNGVGLETYYRRYNARLNSTYSINDHLRIGQNFNFTYSQRVSFDSGDDNALDNAIISLYRMHPLIPVYDVFGGFSGTQASNLGTGRNPIATAINAKDNKDNRFRTLGNAYVELDILQGLTAKTNLGIDYYTSEARTFNPIRLFDENPKVGNDLEERTFVNTSLNWFNTLTYNTKIGDKHDLTALVGTELVKLRSKTILGTGQNLPSNTDVDSQYLALAETTNANSFGSKSTLFSLFGKLDYKFDDKYLLSASVRRDATSKFGAADKDLRSDYFPSVSVGWRLSSESFLEDSSVITNLMLKAGYGEIGNQNLPTGQDQDLTGSSNEFDTYSLGGTIVQGSSLTSRGNPFITWEISKATNFGIDLSLINKINFSFEYYNKETTQTLNIVNSDPTVDGQNNTIAANAGEVTNKGFDISLGFSDETDGGFSYNITGNLSAYKNEVELLDPNNPEAQIFGVQYAFDIGEINNTKAGEPISSFFGYNYQGIDQTTGRAIFEDINGDNAIDGNDRQFIGNPHPDFTYGLNLNAEYKNFDLSIFFQGSQGNDIYNLTKVFTHTSIFQGNKSPEYVNAWTPTNTGATVPALTNDADANKLEKQSSSFFIEDGSYLRLKNIQLGYTLPQTFTNNLKLESVRLYIQAKNLLTFTDYSGLDPEISVRNFNNNADAGDIRSNDLRSFGVDTGAYPISRSVIFGINVSL